MTRDWYLSYPKDAQTAIVNVSHPSLCHRNRLSILFLKLTKKHSNSGMCYTASSCIQAVTLLCMRRLKAVLKVL